MTTAFAVHVDLHDGAYCDVVRHEASIAGTTTLAIHDADGDEALISFDRSKARKIIDAIELVAGLRPTGPKIDLETALAGSLRILLAKIDDDLERANPDAADRLRAMMIAHLRSKRPALLGGGML